MDSVLTINIYENDKCELISKEMESYEVKYTTYEAFAREVSKNKIETPVFDDYVVKYSQNSSIVKFITCIKNEDKIFTFNYVDDRRETRTGSINVPYFYIVWEFDLRLSEDQYVNNYVYVSCDPPFSGAMLYKFRFSNMYDSGMMCMGTNKPKGLFSEQSIKNLNNTFLCSIFQNDLLNITNRYQFGIMFDDRLKWKEEFSYKHNNNPIVLSSLI